VQSLCKLAWRFFKKLKIVTIYDPAILLLGIYSEEYKSIYMRGTCTLFIAALFTIAKLWNQPRSSMTKEGMKKMWYICTMEYYSAIKKHQIMSFSRKWMELEIVMLYNTSQAQKANY
jgi:hypothetical protein